MYAHNYNVYETLVESTVRERHATAENERLAREAQSLSRSKQSFLLQLVQAVRQRAVAIHRGYRLGHEVVPAGKDTGK